MPLADPIRWLLLAALGVLPQVVPTPIFAADSAPASAPKFSRHLVPIFSRLGCNAGLCHGAVQGKNGFRLSLFGVDPALDHQRLTGEFGGRRLDFLRPEESLLLVKATGQVAHGGGRRLDPASSEYRALRDWIAVGAPLDAVADSRVVKLEVTPRQSTVPAGERFKLRVEAEFADGSREDVTHLCTYASAKSQVVEVSSEGEVRAVSVGDGAVVARYRAQAALSTLLVPGKSDGEFPVVAPENFIDDHILARLKLLRIPPSDLCDDATFLRRTSLDLCGVSPAPDEIREFLADASPDKRARKIDELLARPGHSAMWATKFCDLLRPRISYQDFTHQPAPAATRRFYDWIRDRLKENTPYDVMVERILTATSLDGRPREAWIDEVVALAQEESTARERGLSVYSKRNSLDLYWHRFEATGVKGAVQVSHAFLGLRMQCAQCHRHPTDVWTQDDLLSFANFFSRLRANTGVVSVKEAGEIKQKAGGALSVEEKKRLTEEAKRLQEEGKKVEEEAKAKKDDKPAREALQKKARELTERGGAIQRAAAVLDCSSVFPTKGNPLGFATVTSPLGTQESKQFRFLGDPRQETIADDEDPRLRVVAWLRQSDNPFFAKAIVNRVWAHYLGRGLIDPVDDLSPLNPPSHPELLDELCRRFIASGYDLRWLHRTIVQSRSYQLSSRTSAANADDARNFASFYPRRLPAELLVDAVDQATGSDEKYSTTWIAPGSKAIEVPVSLLDGELGNSFVESAFTIFGRPTRNVESLCDCDRDSQPSLIGSLFLANHPELKKKLSESKGRVARIAKEAKSDAERIELAYLWTVARLPTAKEQELCQAHLRAAANPQQGLEGVFWALINSSEFLLNQ